MGTYKGGGIGIGIDGGLAGVRGSLGVDSKEDYHLGSGTLQQPLLNNMGRGIFLKSSPSVEQFRAVVAVPGGNLGIIDAELQSKSADKFDFLCGGQGRGKLKDHIADDASIGRSRGVDIAHVALDVGLGRAETVELIICGGFEVIDCQSFGGVGLDVYGAYDILAFVVAFGDSEGVEGTLAQPATDLCVSQEASCIVVAETAGQMIKELALSTAGNVEGQTVNGSCIEDESGDWSPRGCNSSKRKISSPGIGGGCCSGSEGEVGGGTYYPLGGIVYVEIDDCHMVVRVEGYDCWVDGQGDTGGSGKGHCEGDLAHGEQGRGETNNQLVGCSNNIDGQVETGLLEGDRGEVVFVGGQDEGRQVVVVLAISCFGEVHVVDATGEGAESNGEGVGPGQEVDIAGTAEEAAKG